MVLYYGTTVVYGVRRWPKRRYAVHICTVDEWNSYFRIIKTMFFPSTFQERGTKITLTENSNCAPRTTLREISLLSDKYFPFSVCSWSSLYTQGMETTSWKCQVSFQVLPSHV